MDEPFICKSRGDDPFGCMSPIHSLPLSADDVAVEPQSMESRVTVLSGLLLLSAVNAFRKKRSSGVMQSEKSCILRFDVCVAVETDEDE